MDLDDWTPILVFLVVVGVLVIVGKFLGWL